MLKSTAQGTATRDRILDSAFQTLRLNGYAETSARAIARTGGFNQALIFYHFGSVTDLLLGALDRASAQRMERYRLALESVTNPLEIGRLMRQLYTEDVDSGHSTVLAELLAASNSNEALREQMLKRVKPWLEFTEAHIQRITDGTPLAGLIPARSAAAAVVALYVGLDFLLHLDGDRAGATAIFDAGDRLAAAFS